MRKLALPSTVYHTDGYYPGVMEGLRHASPDAFPPEMREAYERVAPNPEGWPALVAKVAQQAAEPGGLRPEDVQAINVPALVMIAAGDIILPEHAEELARLLRAELVLLPDSDHTSYVEEHPNVLLSILTAFLDAEEPSGDRGRGRRTGSRRVTAPSISPLGP